MVLFFWPRGMWDLTSPTRDWTCTSSTKCGVLSIGLPGSPLFFSWSLRTLVIFLIYSKNQLLLSLIFSIVFLSSFSLTSGLIFSYLFFSACFGVKGKLLLLIWDLCSFFNIYIGMTAPLNITWVLVCYILVLIHLKAFANFSFDFPFHLWIIYNCII